MIGRLVEYQQVDGFKQQTNHSQTAPFASAQHLYFLVRGLAAEHERAQYIVDSQTDIAFRYIINCLEHCQRLVQQLSLVLSEITYLNIVANLQVSIKRNLSHDTLHEC